MTKISPAERETLGCVSCWAVEPLSPAILAALAHPSAYPEDGSASRGIEEVQTHLSHVFLTGDRVYKVRKGVDLGFVDFSTREARNADCLREVTLNRRLAPDVYLGVAPLVEGGDGVVVGSIREELGKPDARGVQPEHCVVMRRLPDGSDALSMLKLGKLQSRHVDAVAERVARFHELHRLPPRGAFDRARIVDPVVANFRALEAYPDVVPRELLNLAAARANEAFEKNAERFDARWTSGRFVDGHGDLHLEHVWFETDAADPLLIDCLEFRDDFRRIDAAADVAFLAMDLIYRERPDLAERFLRRYVRATDDFDLYHVVDYYVAYRACVRSKVAAVTASEPEVEPTQRAGAAGSARRHFDLAADVLAPRGRGALVLLCGIIGTGKSSLARAMASATGGVVIVSDQLRKRLAGLAPDERRRVGWREGIFGREWTERVYDGLVERAEPVVRSGRVAVLDASFPSADLRRRAGEWARERNLAALLVETRCSETVVLERLAHRVAGRQGPSDAAPSHYPESAASFESPTEWPADDHLVVRTDAPEWEASAREALERWLTARRCDPRGR
jgi:aminoglycoside phosphotransferase family enzyme/predicted kinase